MQVGVGNSKLQIDMALDGYASITSVDYSDVVVEQMQQSPGQLPQLRYAVADARCAASCVRIHTAAALLCC